jgi:colicin import membrane protein|tara:strand:+ start:67 stop:792 length:726 start_codon:yes stop_codon:yes gene_type:complete
VAQPAITLDVWKELAIHNQMLIHTVTEALSLDPDCADEELKAALDAGVKRIQDAQTLVSAGEEKNKLAIADIEKKRLVTENARLRLEAEFKELTAEKEKVDALLETTKKSAADESTKLKTQLEEKTKALKTINTQLGDTPQNVTKKLKALNKKKFDETTARQRAEEELKVVKKAKSDLTKEAKADSAKIEKLIEGYKALQAYCDTQYDQLKALVDDKESLVTPPKLDNELLGIVETEEEDA